MIYRICHSVIAAIILSLIARFIVGSAIAPKIIELEIIGGLPLWAAIAPLIFQVAIL
jgi:hypothetical protein